MANMFAFIKSEQINSMSIESGKKRKAFKAAAKLVRRF